MRRAMRLTSTLTSFLLWVAFVGLVLGNAAPATADGHGDMLNCAAAYLNHDYDTALALCSRALESGDLSNEETAMARSDRGLIYAEGKGDYAKAIEDYNEAIRLKPNYANAYNNRGKAYFDNREDDQAIQDYNQAIRLKPDYVSPYIGRSAAYEDRGEHDRAIQDLDRAIRLNPDSPFARLWRAQVLFELTRFDEAAAAFDSLVNTHPELPEGILWLTLARRRAGENGEDALRVHAQGLDLEKWPGPIVRLYLGQISQDAVQAAAHDPDPEINTRQSCEAAFYLAELDLVSGQEDAAKPGFQHVIDSCPKGYDVVRVAKVELSRM